MVKFLAFLIILCILFGVTTARSIVFGALGIIFWIIIALVVLGIIGYIASVYRSKSQEDKKSYGASAAAIISGAVMFSVCIFNSVNLGYSVFGALFTSIMVWVMAAPDNKKETPKNVPAPTHKKESRSFLGGLFITRDATDGPTKTNPKTAKALIVLGMFFALAIAVAFWAVSK